jgi:hypothetical protein
VTGSVKGYLRLCSIGFVQAAQEFTADTTAWLADREETLSGVIFNMGGYCSRVQCGTTIVSAMDTLETLRKDAADVNTALAGHQEGLCPAIGCLNFDFVWVLKNSTCLCDQDAIAAVGAESSEGVQKGFVQPTQVTSHATLHQNAAASSIL